MPQTKLRTAIHNLWPKLLVIVAGFGLYGLAVTWLQGDFKSLVIGIGGGLVSLDIKPAHDAQSGAEPLNAYVVNPDYYAALSDLVYDVVEGINGWKSVSNPIYMDHEAGRIGAL